MQHARSSDDGQALKWVGGTPSLAGTYSHLKTFRGIISSTEQFHSLPCLLNYLVLLSGTKLSPVPVRQKGQSFVPLAIFQSVCDLDGDCLSKVAASLNSADQPGVEDPKDFPEDRVTTAWTFFWSLLARLVE